MAAGVRNVPAVSFFRMQDPVRPPSSDPSSSRRRDAFFGAVDSARLLRPFDEIPGVLYIVKDGDSRIMAISPRAAERMRYREADQILGKAPDEYLPRELAEKFRADDRWVLEHDEPRRNLVEIWFDAEGRRDWVVTSKYPLHDTAGRVIGLIAILQSLDMLQRRLADLGPVGKAVDYIREHLGENLVVEEIARQAGISARQLQRQFQRVLGQSIRQYLIRTRVHAATRELLHSERTLGEIALRFGFNDQSAFSNAFRSIIGMSPREYRLRETGGRRRI